MTSINENTQLSTFSLIRDALLANSTISGKFKTQDIYEFEPKQKSKSFRGFPYIWVNLPFTTSEKLTVDHGRTMKVFSANVYLRVEYLARSNFTSYANAIIAAIEAYESTFQASGYMDVECELLDVDPNTVIDQKELVEGIFEVRWHGQVGR